MLAAVRWRGTGQPQQAKAGAWQGEMLIQEQIEEIVWAEGRKHRKLLDPTQVQDGKSREFTEPGSPGLEKTSDAGLGSEQVSEASGRLGLGKWLYHHSIRYSMPCRLAPSC